MTDSDVHKCREYNEEDIVVISPEYHIRPNKDHCIIYPFDPEEAATWRAVSGIEGIALTLFDGKRTLKDVAKMIAFLFDIEVERGEEVIKSLIKRSNNSEDGKGFLDLYSHNATKKFMTYPTIKLIQKLRCDESGEKSKTVALDAPLSLLFMPSNTCEVDCIYCYSEKRFVPQDHHLSVERWCEIIDESSELGIDIVSFSGGDPLTYPGIEVLLERMVLRRIKFLLPTKAFISKERAKRFADIGMRDMATIQISIDGVTSNVDKLLNSSGYCDRAFASIENLVEQGFFVRTNTVCTPLNVYEVPELVRKLYKLGVKRASVTNYGRSFFRHDDSMFLSSEQINWLNEEIKKIKDELGWEELRCNAAIRDFSLIDKEEKLQGWKDRAHCSGGTSCMTITPDGKVILCEQVPQKHPFIVGDVKERSILEVWNSPEIKEFIHPSRKLFKGTVCEDCDEFDECHTFYGRCFRDAYFTYKLVYAPSPNCPYAPKGLKMS